MKFSTGKRRRKRKKTYYTYTSKSNKILQSVNY